MIFLGHTHQQNTDSLRMVMAEVRIKTPHARISYLHNGDPFHKKRPVHYMDIVKRIRSLCGLDQLS